MLGHLPRYVASEIAPLLDAGVAAQLVGPAVGVELEAGDL
jgi:hypothetical protein